MTDIASSTALIIGAGTMGRQIAAALLGAGIGSIDLVDASPDARACASEWLSIFRPKLPTDRVTVRDSWDDSRRPDIIIEAVPEDENLKRAVLAALAADFRDAALASNSSAIPTSRFVDDVDDPSRLMNLHFYVRPWERRVVELMSSGATSDTHLGSVRSFMEACRFRVFLLRRPSFGLLYNRIWAAVKREALAIIDEGVATPEEVDAIYRALEPSPPRGPFERMDAVGLDTVELIERLYIAERGGTLSPTLSGLVARGRLGEKTGAGFLKRREQT